MGKHVSSYDPDEDVLPPIMYDEFSEFTDEDFANIMARHHSASENVVVIQTEMSVNDPIAAAQRYNAAMIAWERDVERAVKDVRQGGMNNTPYQTRIQITNAHGGVIASGTLVADIAYDHHDGGVNLTNLRVRIDDTFIDTKSLATVFMQDAIPPRPRIEDFTE